MPFTVNIARRPDHVRFNVAGHASLKNYFDLIDDAARETLAHGDTLGMLDLCEVLGRLRFTEQFFIGEMAGKKLAHMVRLAVLVAGDPGSYNSETVARRKGVDLRVFDDEGKALAWLLGEGGAPAG
jgi:hypothetical protein